MTAPTFVQFKADFKAIVFDPIDKDGNGTLDVKEVGAKLMAMVEKIGVTSLLEAVEMDPEGFETMCKALMTEMDTNGDDAISFDEVFAAFIKVSGLPDEAASAELYATKGPKTKEEYDASMEELKTIFG